MDRLQSANDGLNIARYGRNVNTLSFTSVVRWILNQASDATLHETQLVLVWREGNTRTNQEIA